MRGMKNSNPYSSRGLDKFATLNAELDTKREFIARKTGAPKDLVRFTYNSDEWIPILVKGKRDHADPVVPTIRNYEGDKNKKDFAKIKGMDFSTGKSSGPKDATVDAIGVIILLLSIIFFGRLWAIFCTCAWWYLLSTFTHDGTVKYRRITVVVDVDSKKKKKLILDGLMLRSKGLKYK